MPRKRLTDEERAAYHSPEAKAARKAKWDADQAEAEQKLTEALAKFPDLPPDQMSEDGCINLIKAFWEDVRHDLACKSHATRAWVREDGGGFARWCDISHIGVDELRAFLLEQVWGNDEYRVLRNSFGRAA